MRDKIDTFLFVAQLAAAITCVVGALYACAAQPAPPPPLPVSSSAPQAPPPPPPSCAEEVCADRAEVYACAEWVRTPVYGAYSLPTCTKWVPEYRRHCECRRWGAGQ